VICVAMLLAPACSMESSLTFDAEAAKNRPVSKVITLLKENTRAISRHCGFHIRSFRVVDG
jgi:hypothetical protein